MSRKVLGLEIREESVTAVLLDVGFKGSELVSHGFYPISVEKTDDEGIKDALETMVDQLRLTGVSCILGIPTTFVSFRNISIPFNDNKKIRQILPFELEPTLPIPVEELVFDFEAVKREGHQDLLAFSIPKEHIQKVVDLLGSVNLRPATILPIGYATARCISKIKGDGEDLLLIDTGGGYHTVYAVSSGSVRLVRRFPVGVKGTPILRSLETNINRTITALKESQDISIVPASVFSSGPQSSIFGEDIENASLSGTPIASIEVLRTFPRLQNIPESSEWKSGRFDMALALALVEAESIGGINFSTEQSTLTHYWNEYRGKIITTAIFILIVLTTMMADQIFAVKDKEKNLTELDRKITSVFTSTFPEISRVVNPLQQMQIKMTQTGEGSVYPDLPGARVRIIDILNALSLEIPKSVDVNVKRMVVSTDNVVLSGSTNTFNTVNDIKNRLEKTTIFTSVTISSADLEKSGKRVRFKLKMDF